jgi:hypothetical protein
MINTKLQSIIDTKSAIGNAIVNKGGTITSETPFFNYAAQIDGISTGTPQTIFQASDGSKWALTNAVNLVNDAGNVTSDFNYWQPANNSTSDPILNVGTVGANISGNIQLVPVNQVNIAQFENIVINDTTGAKYVGYNGYDFVTNPTPTGNTTFNQWLLNNSASGTVLFANTVITNGGTFNGPNASVNVANVAFINNSVSYEASIEKITTNNGFIYVGGGATGLANRGVSKFREDNLALVGNTVNFGTGTSIFGLAVNNGFIYAVGSNNSIFRYHESNLVFAENSSAYSATFSRITINNGFIYATLGDSVQKVQESNLAFIDNTISYGGEISAITTNNGFIYVGGTSYDASNRPVSKYHESNLVFVGNTANYGGNIRAISVSNGFIYAGGTPNRTVQKFYEGNLVFVGNTAAHGGDIDTLTTNDGFIYVGGRTNLTVKKYYESNLAFVTNTASYGATVLSVTTNNGFIYVGGQGNATANRDVKKYQEQEASLETLTFYTATKIKE